MAIDSTARKSCDKVSDGVDVPGALKSNAGSETHEAASFNSDSQQLLLRAQKNAVDAKEAAVGAINRFYQESQVSEKKAEKMVRDLDEAIQHALAATRKSRGTVKEADKQAAPDDSQSAALSLGSRKKSKLSKKVLNKGNNPFSAVSDLTKSLFGSKAIDAETKEEFYQLIMRQSPQLRQLIDDLTEDKARIKTEKIMAEAKSEIVAARVAVNHAQDEIREAREEAKKALTEAEATKKAAELIISQVKQDAISQIADEVTKSKEEVKIVKEVADTAMRQAEELARQAREEAEAIKNHAQVTISLTQEKVKREAEQLNASRLQAQVETKKAQDAAKKAMEEAEVLRREAQEAINKATIESQQAREATESARRRMQEATVLAEKQAYDKFYEEIKKIREEAEKTNKAAYDAIAKAREESQRAREEVEMVKRSSEEAVFLARQDTLKAQAEVERAKQSVLEVISQAEEDNRKAQDEAESSILKANEAMMQAKQDIISVTRNEIVRAREELEATGRAPEPDTDASEPDGRPEKLDPNYVANVLHEMRAPLHSISGFAKLMLEDNVSDSNTQKEFLSLMVQQSESLNRLIDDLSRILSHDVKAFDINQEPVSPHKIITEAIDSVQAIARQKKNLISHNAIMALPDISADGFRIKQVIINLLTNAIKFSPENSPILVKAGTRDRELLVQVIDRGIGIPEADIPAVFNRYYQAKNCNDASGLGLGLYICRQIIEAHGGCIWAESVAGEGSIFSFTLPLAAAER
jgi:nitrogen-specific signal transduction histidine kinase